MSYTNTDLVRNHLAATGPLDQRVEDQAIVMGESDWVQFHNGAVDPAGFRVKAPAGSETLRQDVTLSDGSAILATAPLVRGSVIIANDSSLGTRYRENVDYVVACDSATVHRKEGGLLTPNAAVTAWYRTRKLYDRDVDYTLDANGGRLRRLASGAVSPHETVYLDYTPSISTHDETLIAAAVLEANGQIAAEVDPDREFGADPVLQSAATCAALAVVCRGAAARALTSTAPAERAAAAWLQLADRYADRAEHLVRKFRGPHTAPSAPTRS